MRSRLGPVGFVLSLCLIGLTSTPAGWSVPAAGRNRIPIAAAAAAAEPGPGSGRADQSNLRFSTYFGGGRDEGARAVAVDSSGMAHFAGWTSSGNLPVKNAFQPAYGGGECRFFAYTPCGDAYIAKVDVKTSKVVYATYLGGPGPDYAQGVAIDDAGNTYVSGFASSGFPIRGPAQSPGAGGTDAFVAKLDPAGSLVYSIVLGGPGFDGANGLDIDKAGNVYLTGVAVAGFPASGEPPPDPRAFGGFVAKVDPAGAVVFSAFIGGRSQGGNSIGVDSAGNAYVAGSGRQDVQPKRTNTEGPPPPPATDAFAAKVTPAGEIAYMRELASPGDDDANAVAVDPSGNAYFAGSASAGFPTKRAVQPKNAGATDAFLTKLNKEGSIVHSTFFGGSKPDAAFGVALSPEGSIYLAGEARDGFPTLGAFQPETKGHTDAFLARFGEAGGKPRLRFSTLLGGTGREFAQSVATGAGDLVLIAGHTDSRSDLPTLGPVQPLGFGQVETFLTAVSSTTRSLPVVSEVIPRSGPQAGGSTVTLKGSNLKRIQSVQFGNRRARVLKQSESGKELLVRTPPGVDGKVAVMVTAEQGVSLPTSGSHFEYALGSWTPIPAATRYHHGATLLSDGRVLVAGGCTTLGPAGDCRPRSKSPPTQIFHKTGQWNTIRSPINGPLLYPKLQTFPKGPRSACGRNCGKTLMVGLTRKGLTSYLFDPSIEKWSKIRRTPPARRSGYTLTLLPAGPSAACGRNCGKIFMVKHSEGGGGAPVGELFDPRTATWKSIPAGPELQSAGALESIEQQLERLARVHRAHHTATLLKDGRVLLIGGVGLFGATIAPSEIYDPVTDKLLAIKAPAVTRYGGHSATLLDDGKVLVIGGMTDNLGTLTFSSEIFDPAIVSDPAKPDEKGAFKPGPSLNTGRYGHAALSLRDGSVLVVGGSDSTGVPVQRGPEAEVGNRLAGAELFQPKTGGWRSSGSMSEGRGPGVLIEGLGTFAVPSFTVTGLPDDRVLVLGGRSAEVYSPSGLSPYSRAIQEPEQGQPAGRRWLLIAALAVVSGGLAAFKFSRRRSTQAQELTPMAPTDRTQQPDSNAVSSTDT